MMRHDVGTLDVVGVGYQGRTADAVIVDLVADGVAAMVDVRLNPVSRKPGLSKTALRTGLAETGIEYLHLPALGNPKDNRAGFAGDEQALATAAEAYRRLLERDQARDALAEIRQRAEFQRLALLCFEADEHRCHRSLVLEALAASPVSV